MMNTQAVRVIIVDDQLSVRSALHALLAFEPKIEIIGETGSGEEAVRMVREKHPDLVLLDVEMPGLNGLITTKIIKSEWPDVRIVVYTIYPNYKEEAYRAGADYFMVKGYPDSSPFEIILSLFPPQETKKSTAAV